MSDALVCCIAAWELCPAPCTCASSSGTPSLQVQASLPLKLQRFAQVMQQMPPEVLEFLTAELSFFDKVTDISGALYSVPKDERKAGAVKLAREVSSQLPIVLALAKMVVCHTHS